MVFSVKILKAIAINFCVLLSMAIGQYSATEKMGIVKGERVEIFQRSVLKNTTRTLRISKRFTSATLLRLQEVVLVFAPFQKGARS